MREFELQLGVATAENQSVRSLRPLLFPVALASLVLGATGLLSPAVSTLLWLPAVLVLTLQSSSPIMRWMSNALIRNGQSR
jgi:hypothetical protein